MDGGHTPLGACGLEEVGRWILYIPVAIIGEAARCSVLRLCMTRLCKLVRRNLEGFTENVPLRLR